jgi:hypothetical protein
LWKANDASLPSLAMKIDSREIQADPASHFDPSGQVFWWRGEVYRAIREPAASFFRDLFDRGVIAQLCESGLVESEMTSMQMDGYDLIVRHQTILPLTYPFEWPSEMLRDAALLTIDLNLKLAELGLTTKDSHAWNVLIEGSRPKWIDLGSITPDRRRSGPITGWHYQFQSYFFYPLHLMSIGKASLARYRLSDLDSPVSMFVILKELPHQLQFRCLLFDVSNGFLRFGPRSSFLCRMRHAVESINLPFPEPASSCSCGGNHSPLKPVDMCDQRHEVLADVLAKTNPKSVLVIGADNQGDSQLVARLGSRVVVLDTDEARLNVLYRDATRDGLPITPLIMDYRQPSPACVGASGGHVEHHPAAVERLRCEFVLALGIVGQLAVSQGLSYGDLVSKLSLLSTRWLLVEFASGDDRWMGESSSDQCGCDSIQSFIREIERVFSHVEVLDFCPAPSPAEDGASSLSGEVGIQPSFVFCER